MPVYRIDASSIASEAYWVTAESEEEARAKIERGEWDTWRDLGHEDMQIINVEEE